jgi:hypothetical protein
MAADQSTLLAEAPAVSLSRLCVLAQADPGALARVLERFQVLNEIPRRVVAECRSNGLMEIVVDTFGLAAPRLTLIAAKLAQVPCVLSAYWHYV